MPAPVHDTRLTASSAEYEPAMLYRSRRGIYTPTIAGWEDVMTGLLLLFLCLSTLLVFLIPDEQTIVRDE